jgi:hypothetical protein
LLSIDGLYNFLLLVVDDGDRDTIASLNLFKRKIVIPDDAFATIKETHIQIQPSFDSGSCQMPMPNHSKRIKAAKQSK